jgi:peptide/nickel transport system substrate-binding protein
MLARPRVIGFKMGVPLFALAVGRGSMDPRSIRIAAIVVAVLTALSASGAYYGFAKAASQASSCALSTTSSIVIDQPEIPDSLDPAVTYTTPGWGIVQQVYQTLVFYNDTEYGPGATANATLGPNYQAPLLAENWTTSTDGTHWNFTLWPNEHFSNGDPLNAYVEWYSLNRGMVMNQALVYLEEENFFLPGLTYDANDATPAMTNTQNWLDGVLNGMDTLASVTSPSPGLLAIMTADNQSFQVINASTIEFNIGAGSVDYNGPAPYPFLLDQLATPGFAAVDPLWVAQHGGITVNQVNTFVSNNMMGSGPYTLTFWSPSSGYSLAPSKDYWGQSIAAKHPLYNNLQPAKSSVDVSFQENPTIVVENMQTGAAALGSFAYIGPSQINELKGQHCLVVHPLPPVFGGLSFAPWVFMDENTSRPAGGPPNPFANLSVRAAVVHSINYNQIVSVALGGYGTNWVGPIPPGYPDYNPSNTPVYSYDPSLALQEMDASPWPVSSGGLTHLYPNGINFEYIQTGDWNIVAQLIKTSLAAIDIPLNLVPMSIDQLALEQYTETNSSNPSGPPVCVSQTSQDGGPFYIGLDYYTGDYVGPDDPTELNAWSTGGYNECMSELDNGTVNDWFYHGAESTNVAAAAGYYGNITNFLSANYVDAWLPIPTSFQVYNIDVQGIVQNPMGSGIGFQLIYNTDYLS